MAAAESLSLRVTNNKFAQHPRIIASQTLVSSGKLIMVMAALAVPSFRRRFGTAEVALLAEYLVMPAVPVTEVSPAELLSAFETVQAAAVSVELVGSQEVRRLANEMMDATRELVNFTMTSPTVWRRPKQSDLDVRVEATRQTRTRLLEAVRREIG